MAVPFCMGKIIDLIYSSSNDASQMMATLSSVSKYLCGIFLLGGAANFGRVYLIQISGGLCSPFVFWYITCRCLKFSLGSNEFYSGLKKLTQFEKKIN